MASTPASLRALPPQPDFRQPAALQAHALSVLDFYDPRAVDASGGHFHFLMDDGRVYDSRRRHLVSSTRHVVLWAMAARRVPAGSERGLRYRRYVVHALDFLRQAHRQPDGHYLWELDWVGGRAQAVDATRHAYGLAFVLLAHAEALMAGVEAARPGIAETFARLDADFWLPQHEAYADEMSAAGELSTYRGQNANMHLVEACLAAHAATGEGVYLDRAATLAQTFVQRLASQDQPQAGGWIWEHYRADWSIDWDYNKGDASNIFRPWGYQPGHFVEWAHLLLTLEQRRPEPWQLPRARELFDAAWRHGWDGQHGGLVYGFGPQGVVCFPGKYHWVQCEALAAAAMLAERLQRGAPRPFTQVNAGAAPVVDPAAAAHYLACYEQLWAHAWQHWVDHEHGAWHRILAPDNSGITREKSPAGKVDYHTTGACWRALDAMAGLAGLA